MHLKSQDNYINTYTMLYTLIFVILDISDFLIYHSGHLVKISDAVTIHF